MEKIKRIVHCGNQISFVLCVLILMYFIYCFAIGAHSSMDGMIISTLFVFSGRFVSPLIASIRFKKSNNQMWYLVCNVALIFIVWVGALFAFGVVSCVFAIPFLSGWIKVLDNNFSVVSVQFSTEFDNDHDDIAE